VLPEDQELLDVVDIHDEVVGTITHTAAYNASGLSGNYLRAASCFLVNTRGKVWIPRRAPHKRIAPNGLDYSAGGHVQSGETYQQAVIREIEEEIGLQVDAASLTYLGKLTPREDKSHYFSALYVYRTDVTPHYSAEEFTNAEWLSPSDLQQRLLSGEPAKMSLLASVKLLLQYLSAEQ
jgi:8-oxo-dGTP pyrophosphatase MutT (NUDIX family)